MKYIIRTSDRGAFKRCRQLWNYTSKMRRNFEYVPGIEPLNFGIAYHEAMEVYYDPILWQSDEAGAVRIPAAENAFMASMHAWKRDQIASNSFDYETEKRWDELIELGLGMMRHYWTWAKDADTNYRPVKTEIEFEVPIPVPEGMYLPDGFARVKTLGPDGRFQWYLQCYNVEASEWWLVVYQGRIDVIVEDLRTNKLWIMDHKTAAQFGESLAHLDLDPQCGSYAWAAERMLGLDIAGVIYSEHRKKKPKPPQVLKSGEFSRNKSQDTTAAVYRQAVIDTFGEDALELYADFIQVLKENEQAFFRRTLVNRNGHELDSVERNIVNEAIDMLDHPRIYPAPSMWNCRGCAFQTPCLADQDGSGDTWVLLHSGRYRDRTVVVEGDQG